MFMCTAAAAAQPVCISGVWLCEFGGKSVALSSTRQSLSKTNGPAGYRHHKKVSHVDVSTASRRLVINKRGTW